MNQPRESVTRSAFKAVSWRILATVTTFVLVFIWTGRWDMALSLSAFEVFLKMLLYFFHERLWQRLAWGQTKNATPAVVWFTGLSGSGKTTIAKLLRERLEAMNHKVEWLDGDVTRTFLPKTGFTKEERNAHVVRTGFIARSLEKNGIFVVASYISPYAEARQKVRDMCDNFVEVYIATPLEECEKRDVKGLYAKARAGQIKHFTGIDDPYEPPQNPDITIDTLVNSPQQAVDRILKHLSASV